MQALELTRRPQRFGNWLRNGVGIAAFMLTACAADPEPLEALPLPLASPAAALGKRLFEQPLPHTNGRSCATCHVLDQGTTLRPEHVETLLREAPDDPLFRRIDADDPAAAEPSYEHLRRGLVRVVLPLADNLDVIDLEGNVITPPDRTIFVWRGVPSVADTAFTGPFQLDGRESSLESQAQAAILSHSEGREASTFTLRRLADFERSLFSSSSARLVGTLLRLGVPEDEIIMPELLKPLGAQARRGREVYQAACVSCHGGATTDRIEQPEAVAPFFVALDDDGNVRFERDAQGAPTPVLEPRPDAQFVRVGFSALTYAGQIGLTKTFNSSVELPRYRLRFYHDGTRRERRVDLPPVPVTVSGSPFDPRPQLDAQGLPIVGPNLLPQAFTTDPGRAVISGDPADFEAFDTPPLRGIARTAPYFHDNSRETLREVLDEYSRFVLHTIPALELPAIHPPEQPGGRRESLTPSQKDDLLVFLNQL
ncbi:MAG TPA: cytochrome c peroxidase [Polyangiales bacterium]